MASIQALIAGYGQAGGGSTPSLVAHVGTAGAPDSCVSGAINTTGANLIVVCVNWYNDITPGGGTLSDSKSNTWTGLAQQDNTTPFLSHRMFYCVNPTVGSGHTFTYSGSQLYACILVQAWSNLAASPFDGQNGSKNSSASSLATGSVTPSQANTLMIVGFGHDSLTATVSFDSGFTAGDQVANVSGNNEGGAMGYLVRNTATATNVTGTLSSGSACLGTTLAVFKY